MKLRNQIILKIVFTCLMLFQSAFPFVGPSLRDAAAKGLKAKVERLLGRAQPQDVLIALYAAIGAKQMDIIDVLFKHQAKKGIPKKWGSFMLIQSIVRKDEGLAKYFVEQNEITKKLIIDGGVGFALAIAAEKPDAIILKYLVEGNQITPAIIKPVDVYQAFIKAALKGQVKNIEYLITSEALQKKMSELGKVFTWAVENRNINIIKLLVSILEKNEKTKALLTNKIIQDTFEKAKLLYNFQESKKVVSYLANTPSLNSKLNPAQQKFAQEEAKKIIIDAAGKGDLQTVQTLIKNPLPPDAIAQALQGAVEAKHVKIVQIIIPAIEKNEKFLANPIINKTLKEVFKASAEKGPPELFKIFIGSKIILSKMTPTEVTHALKNLAGKNLVAIVIAFLETLKATKNLLTDPAIKEAFKAAVDSNALNVVKHFLGTKELLDKITQPEVTVAFTQATGKKLKDMIELLLANKTIYGLLSAPALEGILRWFTENENFDRVKTFIDSKDEKIKRLITKNTVLTIFTIASKFYIKEAGRKFIGHLTTNTLTKGHISKAQMDLLAFQAKAAVNQALEQEDIATVKSIMGAPDFKFEKPDETLAALKIVIAKNKPALTALLIPPLLKNARNTQGVFNLARQQVEIIFKKYMLTSTEVLGVGTDNNIWIREGISQNNFRGATWRRLTKRKDFAYIAVGPEGHIWGVKTNGYIYILTGINQVTPAGNKWKRIKRIGRIGKKCVQISISTDGAWVLLNDGTAWFQDGLHTDQTPGEKIGENLTCISANKDNVVWSINNTNDVSVRAGITPKNPKGEKWEQVPGLKLKQLAVGTRNGKVEVMGIGMDGRIYRRKGIDPGKNDLGTSWEQPNPGARLEQIQMDDKDGICWGRNKGNQCYVSPNFGASWIHIPGGIKQISVGNPPDQPLDYKKGAKVRPIRTLVLFQRIVRLILYDQRLRNLLTPAQKLIALKDAASQGELATTKLLVTDPFFNHASAHQALIIATQNQSLNIIKALTILPFTQKNAEIIYFVGKNTVPHIFNVATAQLRKAKDPVETDKNADILKYLFESLGDKLHPNQERVALDVATKKGALKLVNSLIAAPDLTAGIVHPSFINAVKNNRLDVFEKLLNLLERDEKLIAPGTIHAGFNEAKKQVDVFKQSVIPGVIVALKSDLTGKYLEVGKDGHLRATATKLEGAALFKTARQGRFIGFQSLINNNFVQSVHQKYKPPYVVRAHNKNFHHGGHTWEHWSVIKKGGSRYLRNQGNGGYMRLIGDEVKTGDGKKPQTDEIPEAEITIEYTSETDEKVAWKIFNLFVSNKKLLKKLLPEQRRIAADYFASEANLLHIEHIINDPAFDIHTLRRALISAIKADREETIDVLANREKPRKIMTEKLFLESMALGSKEDLLGVMTNILKFRKEDADVELDTETEELLKKQKEKALPPTAKKAKETQAPEKQAVPATTG